MSDKAEKSSMNSNTDKVHQSEEPTVQEASNIENEQDQMQEAMGDSKSEKAKKTKKAKKPKRRRRTLLGRFLTSILNLLLILIVVIVLLFFYLLDTESGLRTIVNVANHYFPQYVLIHNAEGQLGKRFTLEDVTLNLPNYEPLEIPKLTLDWNYGQLLEKKVAINHLEVEGANLNFTPIEKIETEEEASEPFALKSLNIPINAEIKTIDITNSTLKVDDFYLAMNDIQLINAKLEDNHVTIENTIGDLQALAGPDVDLPFVVALNGNIDIPTETFDLNLAIYAQEAFISGNELNLALNTEVKGELEKFTADLNGRVDWANFLNDPILLKVDNEVTGLSDIKSYLHLKNLSNQIMLNSEWSAKDPLNVDLNLKMNAPYLSQLHPDISGSLMGDINLKGEVLKPILVADVNFSNINAFGLQLQSLLLKANHENYNADILLQLDKMRFDTIYLSLLKLQFDGSLTDEFDLDLLVENLEQAKSAKSADQSVNKIEVANIKESDGEIDETLTYQENKPMALLPADDRQILVKKMEYKVAGKADSHHFNFDLDSIVGTIKSDGIAALTDVFTDPTFTLYLQNSVVSSDFVGDYKLNKPAYFYYRAKDNTVSLSSACYEQGYIVFCAEGGRSVEGINTAVITLNNLPSSLIESYLPPDLSINTKANVTIAGQFTTEEDFVGVVNLALAKGDIRYRFQGREILIPLDKTLLEVHALPEKVTSNLNVDWGKYLRVQGQGEMNDLFKENLVDASVVANIPSFDWVSPLMPVLQDLGGEVLLKGKVQGPVTHPKMGANFSIKDGHLYIASLNSRLKAINLDVALQEGTPEFFIKGNVGTNKGTLNLDGYYNIANFSTELNASGDDIQLADSRDIKVMISPKVQFTGKHSGNIQRYQLKGSILIPELYYMHASMGGAGSVVKVSEDTIIVGDGYDQKRSESFMDNFSMDLNVILGNDILVGAEGLKAHLSGGLKVLKDYGSQPIRGLGVINVGQGQFDIYGQVLQLDRGKIQFSGASITNPALDIQASRQFMNEIEGRELRVGVKVLGSAEAPRVELYSSPTMTDIEIASYLFLGRSPNLGSAAENLMLLNMLRKIAMGEPVSSSDTSLASKVGLTDLGFMETPNGHIGVGLGKRFANSFYVGLGVGVEEGESAFALLRYSFLKYFNVNAAFMSEGESVNLNYSRDF